MNRKVMLGVVLVLVIAVAVWRNSKNYLSPSEARSATVPQRVQVAAVLPLTGPIAYLGEGEALGIRLAVENQNRSARPQVEFVSEDSQGNADVAVTAVRKLLELQGLRVHAVFTTTPVLATLPIYSNSGKDVLVIAQCMIPEVTKGYPFAYRLYATSDQESDLLSGYAAKNNLKRFAALNINNRFGEEGVNFFAKKIGRNGGQLLLREQISFTDKDFRTVLNKIKELKVDGVIIYAYSTTFPLIFRQMQEMGLNLPVLGNLDLALGGLQDKVSPEFLNHVVFPAPRYYFDSQNEKTREFNARVAALGKTPNVDIAYSYDMATLLIRAIQKVGSDDPKRVSSALINLTPFEGATGQITFTPDRDTVADMKLVRWGSKGLELVK